MNKKFSYKNNVRIITPDDNSILLLWNKTNNSKTLWNNNKKFLFYGQKVIPVIKFATLLHQKLIVVTYTNYNNWLVLIQLAIKKLTKATAKIFK